MERLVELWRSVNVSSFTKRIFSSLEDPWVRVEEVLVVLDEKVDYAIRTRERFGRYAHKELLGHTTTVNACFRGVEPIHERDLHGFLEPVSKRVELLESVFEDMLTADSSCVF